VGLGVDMSNVDMSNLARHRDQQLVETPIRLGLCMYKSLGMRI